MSANYMDQLGENEKTIIQHFIILLLLWIAGCMDSYSLRFYRIPNEEEQKRYEKHKPK